MAFNMTPPKNTVTFKRPVNQCKYVFVDDEAEDIEQQKVDTESGMVILLVRIPISEDPKEWRVAKDNIDGITPYS